MHDDLEPLEPGEAMAMYIESREDELADRTLELYEEHLMSFVDWCRDNDIRNMNDVTARTIHRYHLSLKGEMANSSVGVYLSTVRQFIRFCESIDGVARGVSEKIDLPSRDENARDEKLDAERAEQILAYLRKYKYASRSHALMAVLWHTGLRTGTIRALDLRDFDEERERLRIRHRPETGTPLKNGEQGERYVTLSHEVAQVLADYVDEHRYDVLDDHDRNPLFTTKHGRVAKNTIRRTIYGVTRPCDTGRDCPHGESRDSCDYSHGIKQASKCPSSLSGHPIRRGSITHFLRRDVPEKVVSDRMNVSRDVLTQHYDRRTQEEKAEQRRSYLSNI